MKITLVDYNDIVKHKRYNNPGVKIGFKYDPVIKQKAIDQLIAGKTIKDVSKKFGISIYTIRAWKSTLGLGSTERFRYPKDLKDKALKLIEKKLKTSEISKQLDIDEVTINRWKRVTKKNYVF